MLFDDVVLSREIDAGQSELVAKLIEVTSEFRLKTVDKSLGSPMNVDPTPPKRRRHIFNWKPGAGLV